MTRRLNEILSLLFATMLAMPAVAAEPQLTLPTHGALRSVGGGPVADGKYVMTFSIHDAEAGGKTLWSEVHAIVAVKAGSFHVRLGTSATAKQTLDDAQLPWDKPLWLGFRVSDDPELSRSRLGSVGLAAHALSAGSLTGGIDGKKLLDASVPPKSIGFAYAGATVKGGPAVKALTSEVAKDLQCTGCVSVAEIDFDGDIKLGAHSLWADKLVAKSVEAGMVSAPVVLAKGVTTDTLHADLVDTKAVKAGSIAANTANIGALQAATATAQSGNFGTVNAVKFTGDGSAITGIEHPPNPAGECGKGEVMTGIDKDGKLLCTKLPETGLKGVHSVKEPACDAASRGTLWFQPNDGKTDRLSVCARDAAGNYAWRKLYGSEPIAIQTGKCTSHSNFCGGPNNTCTVKLTCPAGQVLSQVRLITQNCNGCNPGGNGSEQKSCDGKTECSLSFKHGSGCCCDSDDYRTGYAKAVCI